MNEVSIVMYHYVRPIKDSKFPGIKGLEKYLRITLGPREDMKKVIKIIKQYG